MASKNEFSSIKKNIMQSFNSSTTSDGNIGNIGEALGFCFKLWLLAKLKYFHFIFFYRIPHVDFHVHVFCQ